MYLYPYDLLVPILLCVGFEINYTWKTGAVCFPEWALKIKLSDQIDQISPPPFLKHFLTPQNDFGIKSLGKFESVPYIARCENRSLDKFETESERNGFEMKFVLRMLWRKCFSYCWVSMWSRFDRGGSMRGWSRCARLYLVGVSGGAQGFTWGGDNSRWSSRALTSHLPHHGVNAVFYRWASLGLFLHSSFCYLDTVPWYTL